MINVEKTPPFNPLKKCPKCGHDDIKAVYRPDAHSYGCSEHHKLREPECCTFEHIDRTCTRCRYEWAEPALDLRPTDREV